MRPAARIVGVTGATGSLGSAWLLRQLASDRELQVVALARDPARAARSLAGVTPADSHRVRFVAGDLAAPELPLSTREAMRVVNVAWWHFAATTNLANDRETAVVADAVNDHGTRRLLAVFRSLDASTPFFHISTAFVAGVGTGRACEVLVPPETRHRTAYEHSKAAAEHHVWEYLREGRPGGIFRPSLIVGETPGGVDMQIPTLVARAVVAALRDGRQSITVDLPHDVRVNVVDRSWVLDAMEAIASRQLAPSIYHLTARRGCTLAGLAAAVARAVPRFQITFSRRAPEPPAAPDLLLQRVLASVRSYFEETVEFDRSHLEAAAPEVVAAEPDMLELIHGRAARWVVADSVERCPASSAETHAALTGP